jgi:hypothetical protein
MIFKVGQKFPTNRFVENFLQSIYRLIYVPWHMRSTCYLNNMCFLYAFLIVLIKKICVYHMFKGHISFLYVGCRKNFCPLNFLFNLL